MLTDLTLTKVNISLIIWGKNIKIAIKYIKNVREEKMDFKKDSYREKANLKKITIIFGYKYLRRKNGF